jgi:hypothetical protein
MLLLKRKCRSIFVLYYETQSVCFIFLLLLLFNTSNLSEDLVQKKQNNNTIRK